MTSIKSLISFKLDLPPSCIEFFPLKPNIAVIGTYNLEKSSEDSSESKQEGTSKPQSRNGSLVLIRVDGDNVYVILSSFVYITGAHVTNSPSDILQNLSTPSAILDVHFLSHVPSSNFGVATSTGSFSIYELVDYEKRTPKIVHIKTIQYFAENILVTAFQWHPESYMVGMTCSDGSISLGVIDQDESEDGGRGMTLDLAKHDLEAWTLAFALDGSGVLSGGDDSALKLIELSEDHDHEDTNTTDDGRYKLARYTSWTDKKIHSAGITAILPLHLDNEAGLVITGSYDDTIRLLHISPSGQRRVLTDMNLGGGVWRLKLLDRKPTLPANHAVEKWRSEPPPTEVLLLVSCMHAGARVVKLRKEGEEWKFEVLAKMEEHASMNYGSDCQPRMDKEGRRTFVSTSFYDRLLCLWRF
jgi:diphthamide biosynthesis protein 7